jgi:hypothetical protein
VSGSARRKLKTARENESGTGGLLKLGYATLLKSREALTRVPKRPRSGGSSLIKKVNPLYGPRDSYKTRDLYGGLDYGHQ